MARNLSLDDLRRFAVSRSLFPPLSLKRAIEKLGFVQADPIRAPARAQDLTLRHRVRNYRAGDLERRYKSLGVEEDVLVNYGFVSNTVHALMHPRERSVSHSVSRQARVEQVLSFVRTRGEVHPREVDAHFAHGTITNYWGGVSNATTHLLDLMHYQGLLRVSRREKGIRIYAVRDVTTTRANALSPRDRVDALVDVAVGTYAPLTGSSLSSLVGRLRYAVPQWRRELKTALPRSKERLGHARVGDIEWYWPSGEQPEDAQTDDTVRFLAPFDPVVWDRRRFELFWGWSYRFEAYTPILKRKFGYYALPMLWRDRAIGWTTLSVVGARLETTAGFVESQPPRDRGFRRELEAELDRMRVFLGLQARTGEPAIATVVSR